MLDTIIEAQNQDEALKNQDTLVDELRHQLISCSDEAKSINDQIEQSENTKWQLCNDILSQLTTIEDAQNKQKALNECNSILSELKQKQSVERQERGNISDQITEKQNDLFKEKERVKNSVDNMTEIIKQVSEQQESEYEKLSDEYRKCLDSISSEHGIEINDDVEIASVHDIIKWICEFKRLASEQRADETFITDVLKAEDEYISFLNSMYQKATLWNNTFSKQVVFFINLFD